MLAKIVSNYQPDSATEGQLDILQLLGKEGRYNTRQARDEIREAFNTKPIGPLQRMELLRTVTYDELCQILKRKVTTLDEITVKEYGWIMTVKKHPEKLYLKIVNHPLVINEHYEYGYQETEVCPNNKMYYLLTYDMMMLDIDGDVTGAGGETREDHEKDMLVGISCIAAEKGLTVRVYRTFNGYHVFVTSCLISHRSPLVLALTRLFGGDIYYGVFSSRVGYKIRLNRKITRDNDITGQYVGRYGRGEEQEKALQYLAIHDHLIAHHIVSEDPYSF